MAIATKNTRNTIISIGPNVFWNIADKISTILSDPRVFNMHSSVVASVQTGYEILSCSQNITCASLITNIIGHNTCANIFLVYNLLHIISTRLLIDRNPDDMVRQLTLQVPLPYIYIYIYVYIGGTNWISTLHRTQTTTQLLITTANINFPVHICFCLSHNTWMDDEISLDITAIERLNNSSSILFRNTSMALVVEILRVKDKDIPSGGAWAVYC